VTKPVKVSLVCRAYDAFVKTVLRYDPRTPYEATVTFTDGDEVTHWVFARELLIAGLSAPAGVGDVRIRPLGGGHLLVSLTGDVDGDRRTVDMIFPARPVRQFVQRCLALVPDGHEAHVVTDHELAKLLEEGCR
jgi:hypothetical protein